jgi:hypothetical protein
MTEREAFEAWSKTYDWSQGMGGAPWAAWQARASKPKPAQEPHDNKADVIEPHPMLSATHFCINCRALWRQCDDFTFNLRSTQCCDKCNNAPVGGQLVPLYTAHPMRCGKCGVEFSDRQPGTLCPKCYIELEASKQAQEPVAEVMESGVLSPSALVRVLRNHLPVGTKLYDGRSGQTVWSDNPALVIRDYLVNALAVPSARIDQASFDAAANLCDEYVTMDTAATADPAAWAAYMVTAINYGTWEFVGGTTVRQRRYRFNGVVESDDTPGEVLEQMVQACAGWLSYTGGVWRLVAVVVGEYGARWVVETLGNVGLKLGAGLYAAPLSDKATQDRIDAERYRWLRSDACNVAGEDTPMIVAHAGGLAPMLLGEEADAAIDAALEAEVRKP